MRTFLALAIFLIITVPTGLAHDELQIGGYYKNFFTVFDSPVPNEPVIGAVANRLRFNLSYAPADRLSFDFSYDFAPRVQDPSLFSEPPIAVAIDPLGYRVVDLDSPIYPNEDAPVGSQTPKSHSNPQIKERFGSLGVFQNLDRASVQFSTAFADISLGRQAVAWGSGRVINPTDVLAPYTYNLFFARKPVIEVACNG